MHASSFKFVLCRSAELFCLSDLSRLDKDYRAGHIPPTYYDAVIALNVPDYQLAGSPACMRLWNAVNDCVKELRTQGGPSAPQAVVKHFDELVVPVLTAAKKKPAFTTTLGNPYITVVPCSKGARYRHFHVELKLSRTTNVTRATLKGLNDLFPFHDETDRSACNLTFKILVLHCFQRNLGHKVKDILALNPLGRSNVSMTAQLFMSVATPHAQMMQALVRQHQFCGANDRLLAAFFKNATTAARRNSRWYDGSQLTEEQISALAYWELPFTRHGHTSDWHQEMVNRCEATIPLTDPHTGEDLLNEVVAGVKRVIGPAVIAAVPHTEDFASFCARRHEWAAAGSSGGQKVRYYDPDAKRMATLPLNKRAFLDNVTTEEMVKWIDLEPKIVARGSEKFEFKPRAIYATDIIDYVMVTYVIEHIEPRLNLIDGIEIGVTGIDEMAAVARRIWWSRRPGLETTMTDYADFNLQHSLAAQTAVFTAIRDVADGLAFDPDFYKAVAWCEAAFSNQHAYFPKPVDRERPCVQGLFSGVRATNFINTILNLVYFEIVRSQVKLHYNLEPDTLFRVHQGDDVWISNFSRLWAAVFFTQSLAVGFVMQPSKQMFDIQTGEFLRVRYKNGRALGYMARAIAGFILRTIQSTIPLTPTEHARGLDGQIRTLYRRLASPEACRLLWHATVPHFSRMDSDRFGPGAEIPFAILKASTVDGGLDLGPPGTYAVPTGCSLPNVPLAQPDLKVVSSAVASHASKEIVKRLSERMKIPMRSDKLQDVLHEANVTGSMRPKDRINLLRETAQLLRDKFGKWQSPSVTRSAEARAAMLGSVDTYRSHARQFDSVCEPPTPPLKFNPVFPSGINPLLRQIGRSSFGSLTQAKIALDVSAIDAATVALTLSPSGELRDKATSIHESLCARLSPALYEAILGGERVSFDSFSDLLRPDVLSVISDTAFHLALSDPKITAQATTSIYRRILFEKFQLVLKAVLQYTTLVDQSHF